MVHKLIASLCEFIWVFAENFIRLKGLPENPTIYS